MFCSRVYQSVQQYTRVDNSGRGWTIVYKGGQQCTRVYSSGQLRVYSNVQIMHNGVQQCTRVYTTQNCTQKQLLCNTLSCTLGCRHNTYVQHKPFFQDTHHISGQQTPHRVTPEPKKPERLIRVSSPPQYDTSSVLLSYCKLNCGCGRALKEASSVTH